MNVKSAFSLPCQTSDLRVGQATDERAALRETAVVRNGKMVDEPICRRLGSRRGGKVDRPLTPRDWIRQIVVSQALTGWCAVGRQQVGQRR